MADQQTLLLELWRLMRQEGIAHYTQEAIISRVSISAATFQENFRDMEDLVGQVLAYDLEHRNREHQRLFEQENSPLRHLLTMVQVGLETLTMEKPDVLKGIMEKYSQTWATFWEQSNTYNSQLVHELLNEGVLQGELRKDINIQLVTKIIIEQVSLTVNPEIFPPEKYNVSEVFRSIFLYYIKGLCADTAIKVADDFFSRLN